MKTVKVSTEGIFTRQPPNIHCVNVLLCIVSTQYAYIKGNIKQFWGKKRNKNFRIGRQLRNRRKSIQYFEKKNYITRNIFFWDERRTWEWGVGGVATVLTTPGRS